MVMSYRGILHQVVSRGGSMVIYREVCPEGVQNKCPGGGGGGGYGVEALCPGGDTLILVISRGVQLYYGIARCYHVARFTVWRHLYI